MSRKPSFANLRDRSVPAPAPVLVADAAPADAGGAFNGTLRKYGESPIGD